MKQLAKLGLGVALIAPWVAEKELAEGSLVMRPTPRSKVTRQWVVIRQGHRELRKPEQTFIGPLPNGGRPSRQTIRRSMALRAGQRGLQEASKHLHNQRRSLPEGIIMRIFHRSASTAQNSTIEFASLTATLDQQSRDPRTGRRGLLVNLCRSLSKLRHKEALASHGLRRARAYPESARLTRDQSGDLI